MRLRIFFIALLLSVSSIVAQQKGTVNERLRDLKTGIDSLAVDIAAKLNKDFYNLTALESRDIDSADFVPIMRGTISDGITYKTPIGNFPVSKATQDSLDSLAEDIANTVDLTSAQTITGQKTFSNNKTVFGTTTNDSVAIRGRLNVDYNAIFKNNLDVANRFRVGDYTADTNSYMVYTPANELLDIRNTGLMLLPHNGSVTPDGKNIFTAADYEFLSLYRQSIYTFGGFVTDGKIQMNNTFTNPDTSILRTIEGYDDTLRINGQVFINGNYYTPGGSVSNADSLGGLAASSYVTKAGIDTWSTNLYSGSSDVMRLGKSYADRRFNNGAYTDIWIIDYVVPPYNLSAAWLFPIEHRVDYFNDTLQTISSVANLLYVDTVGTGIWRSNDVNISGVETQVNVGDLPDSTTLVWANTGLYGNKIVLSESNLTATAKRFPMKVKGYSFDIGTNAYYTYPELYSYYSNLGSGNLEKAYHFYGEGNYPSYFGGNILTDGYIKVQDSIIIGSATVKIYPDSITIGGTRVAKITEAGSLDTSIVNDLIEANEDTTGSSIIGTAATLDSIITDYWNDNLGGSTIDTSIVNNLIEANEDTSGSSIIGTTTTLDSIITDYWNDNLGSTTTLGGLTDVNITTPSANQVLKYSGTEWVNSTSSAFDSTFVYQRIAALEDSITYIMNALSSILAALDTCGCGAVITDNTPPAKPTSFVAIGGTSETQYVSTWTDPTASDLDSIRFYEGSTNDSTALTYVASIPAGTQTYTRTGRTANTTYWASVKAIDDSGNVSYFSNIDSAKTLATVSADTGFYKFDAEDGLANLIIDGDSVVTSTEQVYAGIYSYKIKGTGSVTRVMMGIHDFPTNYDTMSTIWVTFRVYIPNSTTTYDGGWAWSQQFSEEDGYFAALTDPSFGFHVARDSIYDWMKPQGSFISTNFSRGEWHKIECKYVKGTGANSQDSMWVDETAVYGISNGTATSDVYMVRFGAIDWSMNVGKAIYYDDIILSEHRLPLD